MYKISKKNALLCSTILCCALQADAGTGSNTELINVTASIANTCSFGTTLGSTTAASTNLAFGSYVSTAASTATASLSVTCTNGTAYTISLNPGLNATSGFAREMKGASTSALLAYNLGTTSTNASSGSPLWGDGTASSNVYTATSTGTTDTVTVYGYVPAGQTTPGADSYSDTVTASLTFP